MRAAFECSAGIPPRKGSDEAFLLAPYPPIADLDDPLSPPATFGDATRSTCVTKGQSRPETTLRGILVPIFSRARPTAPPDRALTLEHIFRPAFHRFPPPVSVRPPTERGGSWPISSSETA